MCVTVGVTVVVCDAVDVGLDVNEEDVEVEGVCDSVCVGDHVGVSVAVVEGV